MLYLIVGPPAAGKSTWVAERAKPGDITIDYDALANVLSPHDKDHDHTVEVKTVTKAARKAAIDAAVKNRHHIDVYVIHSTPSKDTLLKYHRLGAQIVVVDPGEDVVASRARVERPWWMHGAVKRWYTETASFVAEIPTAGVAEQPEQRWVAPRW